MAYVSMQLEDLLVPLSASQQFDPEFSFVVRLSDSPIKPPVKLFLMSALNVLLSHLEKYE